MHVRQLNVGRWQETTHEDPHDHQEHFEHDSEVVYGQELLDAELGATVTICQRKGKLYRYVTRWDPARVVAEAGYRVPRSNGHAFDRYVCPSRSLLFEDALRQRISALSVNPNKREALLVS